MLEHAGRLLTWSLPAFPIKTSSLICEQLPDHRMHYLDYEGEIAGNRGQVQRVEAGELEWLREPQAGACQAKLNALHRTKTIELSRVANSASEWLATITFE
jgi:hypothetical protein